MSKKQFVVKGKEAREKLLKGINKVALPVIATLGPAGRNVIYTKDGVTYSTKDGVSVAKAIQNVKDPVENLGVSLIKQSSLKTVSDVGDGTTTSTLIAQKLIQGGFELLNNGVNASDLKRGVDIATQEIIHHIYENISQNIQDENQLKQIAMISSNNDEEVGELVSTALSKVGIDGMVHIEESKTGETYLENVEGVQFEKGYSSHYFVTNNEDMTCSLNEPYILIANQRLTKSKEIIPILESISNENKPLLIIADDIEGEALATLIVNKMRGTIKVAAVKAPEFGDRRKLFLEDVAIMTGGTAIDPDKAMRLDRLDTNWLGKARVVNITKFDTTIVDGKGDEKAIDSRIKEIQSQINNATTPFEREKLQERLAKIVGGVSIIHVGGNTELEIKEKKDRVEDALLSTKSAIDGGIVPGGGNTLIHVQKNIKKDILKNITQKYGPHSGIGMGAQLVFDVCYEPFKVILSNAGVDPIKIYGYINQIENKSSSGNIPKHWLGFNLKTEKVENLLDAGLIDATKVVVKSLENAASVASTAILTEALIADEVEDNESSDDMGGVDISQFGY